MGIQSLGPQSSQLFKDLMSLHRSLNSFPNWTASKTIVVAIRTYGGCSMFLLGDAF